tara:strand:- start:9234 stop:9374 length:141 start_codon:yes stop_codon:yes gene_type:complete
MKNFIIGYIAAMITMFIVSCSVTPLEASNSKCGEDSWNPCYVKIVE